MTIYPGKAEILAVEKKHSWHPFTQMKDFAEGEPLVIVSAKGIKLKDADGKEYFDTVSSWWTNILGHGRAEITQSVKDQLDQLEHVLYAGITHPPAAAVMQELAKMLDPKLSRFFFSDDGSTAVEVALKMAFQHYQNQGKSEKCRFAMLNNAYHGDTLGAVSVGGVDLFHKIYKPLLFETLQAATPDCSSCPHRKSEYTLDARSTGCQIECFSSMEKILREHRHELAAVIVEPLILAAGGLLVYPPAYLNKLFAVTKELNILVIFDEVATGFGRTGTMFAYQQTTGVPDLICFSKGLTGGYLPMAMTVATEEIFHSFYDSDRKKTFFHGHSYTANPLSCAASAATLQVLQKENLPYAAQDNIAFFQQELTNFAKIRGVNDIRYLGWIGCVDLCGPDRNGTKPLSIVHMQEIYRAGLEAGLILRPLGNAIYWWLPLVTTKAEIAEIMHKSFTVINSIMQRVYQ